MRRIQAWLFAGAAMIITGAGAQAEGTGTHTLAVQLPDGTVAHIQYRGDIPPQVYVDASPARPAVPWLFPVFGPNAPFAALDRISEEMDREAARMLDEAAAMPQQLRSPPEGLIEAYSGGFPAEAHSYSIVSTFSPSGVCGKSVEITSQGTGTKPRVVTRSFGNCGAAGHVAPPKNAVVPPKPAHRPETIEASNRASRDAGTARRALTQEAALRY